MEGTNSSSAGVSFHLILTGNCGVCLGIGLRWMKSTEKEEKEDQRVKGPKEAAAKILEAFSCKCLVFFTSLLVSRNPKLTLKAVPRLTSCLNQEEQCRPMRTCNTKETRQLAVTADEGGHLVQLPKLRCLSPPVGGASIAAFRLLSSYYAIVLVNRREVCGRGDRRHRRRRRRGRLGHRRVDVAARVWETTKRVRDERLKALGR
ncbi:hypothetical protein Y032_0658g1250 [Ancylostoma ceylanicum]|uniref:Uncharacterized protein n=1 Tax=Ancylostoma ceylanicum TaxID=53326 RepID=A0A016WJC3_9BILA|nr:hypothetical protein Y032_0658g1250 [Ancylostoma ceylanicum]